MRTHCIAHMLLVQALAWPALGYWADSEPPSQPPSPEAQSPLEAPPVDPLVDPAIPQAGQIEPDLSVEQRNPSNWFNIPPEKEWLNFIRDPLKALDAEHGLAITGAYTMLFQQSIGQRAQSAGAGDFDLTAKWTLLGRGTKDTGSFYIATEYRHDIGHDPPSDLGGEIGTLLGTTNGFSDRGWLIKDAYWVQRLFEDRFRFGIGRADPENLVGLHKLQSANTSFLNKAFSLNPMIALPGIGSAVALSVRPTETIYINGGLNNAYGNTTTMEFDKLDELRFFKWVEFGFTPKIDRLGEGRYRLALWHLDSRDLTDRPSDEGFSIIADQDINDRTTVFARYGYANADLTGIEQSVQIGGAIEGLLGVADDLTGIAASWSEPTGDRPDEKVIEIFHRFQLTGRVQFTVGVQVIFDPSNSPGVGELGVLSGRLRMSF